MKRIFYFFILTLAISLLQSSRVNASSGLRADKITTINSSDSIIFDLGQIITTLNYVEFPVYFSSDDSIYAVDFSMKYNQSLFAFDSIVNLTSGLQVTSFFNSSDSTLRFTSNSLQVIPNNQPIISMRFIVLSGQLCNNDLTDIITYLNGDVCSWKVRTCVANGIPEFEGVGEKFQVYPNPFQEELRIKNISTEKRSNFSIKNILGQSVYEGKLDGVETMVDIQNLEKGLYFISFDDQQGEVVKVVKQ